MWTLLHGLMFIIFTPLVFLMKTGFITIYGVFYLLTLFLALGVTIRMNELFEKRSPEITKPVTARPS